MRKPAWLIRKRELSEAPLVEPVVFEDVRRSTVTRNSSPIDLTDGESEEPVAHLETVPDPSKDPVVLPVSSETSAKQGPNMATESLPSVPCRAVAVEESQGALTILAEGEACCRSICRSTLEAVDPLGGHYLRILSLPAESEGSNQDCLGWRVSPAGMLALALADGASTSFMPHILAECALRRFLEQLPRTVEECETCLNSARNDACARIQELAHNASWLGQAQFASHGSRATFMGLVVDQEVGHVLVFAIGDCCLFELRENGEVRSFPEEPCFGPVPDVISLQSSSTGKVRFVAISQPSQLLVATDAVAQFVASKSIAEQRSLVRSFATSSRDEVLGILAKAKADCQLPIDDATFASVRLAWRKGEGAQ